MPSNPEEERLGCISNAQASFFPAKPASRQDCLLFLSVSLYLSLLLPYLPYGVLEVLSTRTYN